MARNKKKDLTKEYSSIFVDDMNTASPSGDAVYVTGCNVLGEPNTWDDDVSLVIEYQPVAVYRKTTPVPSTFVKEI